MDSIDGLSKCSNGVEDISHVISMAAIISCLFCLFECLWFLNCFRWQNGASSLSKRAHSVFPVFPVVFWMSFSVWSRWIRVNSDVIVTIDSGSLICVPLCRFSCNYWMSL